ncbi:RNA 3'-terminal phosphate cyclase-like [Oopsacas minuta]|uniref:RNA 3'-terminal phosphate cyclase n=1 Tax=Oopsacas minuta TaxID=111878 RepID=A0AAV7JVG5_9METZ|nr:RNA 3'-terminal phosphate cyclase-like [Oopsacas minuta]
MATKSLLTVIDGSLMEGGGQILRNSVSCACICRIPIRVKKIRGGRTKPGLQRQHLMGIRLAEQISCGRLEGAELLSQEIVLNPESIIGGDFYSDVKSAGSVMLLLQIALPCLLYASKISSVILKGGTNASFAPQVDHTHLVLCPISKIFGINFDITIKKRGFFPKGGGEVKVDIEPVKKLNCVSLQEMGEVLEITGVSFVAGRCPPKVLHTMTDAAEALLTKSLPGVKLTINRQQHPHAMDTASGLVLCAVTSTGCYIGGSSLGSPSELPEGTGEKAALELLDSLEHKACVDKWTQDQLILLMALAEGKSVVRCGPITLHTETAVYIAEKMLGAKFEIKPVDPAKPDCKKYPCFIVCEGIGKLNPNFI